MDTAIVKAQKSKQRIQDLTDRELSMLVDRCIAETMARLGQKKLSKEELSVIQNDLRMTLISGRWYQRTVDEILLAIAKGALQGEHFLSSANLHKWLRTYEEERAGTMKRQKEKEGRVKQLQVAKMTNEEKVKYLERAFSRFKGGSKGVTVITPYEYEYLQEVANMQVSAGKKWEHLQQAILIVQSMFSIRDYSKKREYSELHKKAKNKEPEAYPSVVIATAKQLAVKELYQELIEMEMNIADILKIKTDAN
jgi:hypothetical protein